MKNVAAAKKAFKVLVAAEENLLVLSGYIKIRANVYSCPDGGVAGRDIAIKAAREAVLFISKKG